MHSPTHDLATKMDDSFLDAHLNPLFLQAVRAYWQVTLTPQGVGVEEVALAQYNLLRFVFRRLFAPLYLRSPLYLKGKMFLLASIHGDGIGDYFALLKSARYLVEAYPEIEVQVVFRHEQPLPKVDLRDYLLTSSQVHAFCEVTDRHILEEVLEGKVTCDFEERLEDLKVERCQLLLDCEEVRQHSGVQVNVFDELLDDCERQIQHLESLLLQKQRALALYQEMQGCLAIVHIALALNTFDNPLLASKSLYFSEAGNFAGIANYLERNWFSMGMQPFEEGIFLERTFDEIRPWQDEGLTKLLWHTPIPSPEQIAVYQAKHSLHVGYLTRIEIQQLIFIYLIVAHRQRDLRHIDIVLPKLNFDDFTLLDKEWLAAQGIGQVMLVDFDVDDKERLICTTGAPVQKCLRLIHVYPIPAPDFEKLLELSEDIVGCTGDLSLSDCLIAGKVPYYELREHKIETWQALKLLATHLKLTAVCQYLDGVEVYGEMEPVAVVARLTEILKRQDFMSQWKQLIGFIKQNYSFKASFHGNMQRFLQCSAHPDLERFEDGLVLQYLNGTISLLEAYEAMQQHLEGIC